MKYYGMPVTAIMRVLGHGRKFIEEHLALIEKHFPTEKVLEVYLKGQGIAPEDIC